MSSPTDDTYYTVCDDCGMHQANVVQLPLREAAFLVAEALHHLWQCGEMGCCPRCCAPCFALNELLGTGKLDELYGHYVKVCGGEHHTWDHQQGQVNRNWLKRAWSGPCSPECGDAA